MFEPETRSKRNTKYYCMLQTNYSTKISPYFSMGYNFKCHKNTFYRLTMHPPVWKWKNISGQIVLIRPPWPVFLMNFPLNPPCECKQLRDAGGHPDYILRFQQTADGCLRTFEWKKRNTKWSTLNYNIFKGVVVEISVIKNVNWIQFTWSSGVKAM